MFYTTLSKKKIVIDKSSRKIEISIIVNSITKSNC